MEEKPEPKWRRILRYIAIAVFVLWVLKGIVFTGEDYYDDDDDEDDDDEESPEERWIVHPPPD